MNIRYGEGENSTGVENFILFTENVVEFDYLVITDSRGGMTKDLIFNNSFLFKLKSLFCIKNQTYLILSRPKYLTVFATLINFIKLNPNLKFKNLVTNLGFVDCTPKKQGNVDDILTQISQFSSSKNLIIEHEKYELSNGKQELLKSIEYTKEYIKELKNFFNKKFEKYYFINTPLVSEDITIERKRPKSFFAQLYKTNNLIDKIVDLNTN